MQKKTPRKKNSRRPAGRGAATPKASVGFITLGCAKNLVDAQIMAGELMDAGHPLAPSPETADVIIVNTCSFIADAREEAAEALLRACAHRDAGACLAVVAAGCLPQRFAKSFMLAFSMVDLAIGVDELDLLPRLIEEVLHPPGERQRLLARSDPPVRTFEPRHPTLLFSGGPFAYLKIAEGCAHRCAFCAIPGIRGRPRSRTIPNLTAEARALVGAGVRELNIIAQDTTSYGRDLKDGSNLARLVAALDAIDGDYWLRLLYTFPSLITNALLDTMAAARHLVRYIDVPIQHSHPAVLKAMGRGGTAPAVATLCPRLRAALPGVAIRTTCLVGFPGETEAQFKHLLEFVAASEFDHLGAFVYSPESETPAYDLKPVPQRTAENRRARLMEVQQGVVRKIRRRLIGQETRALLLAPAAKDGWRARLERQAPGVDGETVVRGVPAALAQPGALLPVTITGGRGYDLTAAFKG